MTWEMQQLLNVQLSMLAVYVKRGVPIIGINTNGMEESEISKMEDAEVLEFVRTRGAVGESVGLLSLQPPIQHLLQGIQTTLELMRQVGGNSRMLQGARENVESATEANLVSIGGEIRNDHRARAVERFAAEIVRKDWQIFQQTVTNTQVLDIVGHTAAPILVHLTPDQIKSEYEFSVQVGSTEPASETKERNRLVSFLATAQSDPKVYAQMRPDFLAHRLAEAFGFDPLEVLTSQEAATQQVMVDALETALFKGGKGAQNGSGIGAALDAMKTQDQGGPIQ
jgi:hypothetical protein